jgi:adenine-specific DNA-methyltransferase
MAAIDELLKRIDDADLRKELTAAVAEVRRTKDYGLVFESHLPETVRLPQHAVRLGVKVARRDATDKAHGVVIEVSDGLATVAPLRDADGALLSPSADDEPVSMPIEAGRPGGLR